MSRYAVKCQDAAGNSVEIIVKARTDELACTAALRELNTWKAVRALPIVGPLAPGTLSIPAVKPAAPEVALRAQPQEVVVGLRIVHKAGPTDWIQDYLARGGKTSALGRALAEATRE